MEGGAGGHTSGQDQSSSDRPGARAVVSDRGGGQVTYPPSGTAPREPGPGRPSAPVTVPAQRRGVGAEAAARLRAAATTEPGRLQIYGAVLALLVVVFGAVTYLEIAARASSADDRVTRSQPLSADAASIYRSLAD